MRLSVLFAATSFSCMAAQAQSYTSEPGTYRLGGTYSISPSSDAETCAANCAADEVCKAWSFQRETGLGPAQCELKNSVGRSAENPLMVSGISPRLTGASLSPAAGSDTLLGGPAENVLRASTVRSAPAKLAAPEPIAPILQEGNIIFESEPVAPIRLSNPEIIVEMSAAKDETKNPDPETSVQPVAPAPNLKPVAAGASQGTGAPYQRLRGRTYPTYSVTRDAITSPPEPIEIDHVELGGEDLAADIAEPVIQERNRLRGRNRSGS